MAAHSDLTAEKSEPKTSDLAEDDELSNLLESALQDFKKPIAHGETEKSSKGQQPENNSHASPNSSQNAIPHPESSADLLDDLFKSTFDSSNAPIPDFGAALKQFMQQEPDMMKEFDKIVQEAAAATEDLPDSHKGLSEDFEKLAQSFSAMADTENQQQTTSDDKDFLKAFGGLGPGPGLDSDMNNGANFFPLMQEMMQTLMSKEILYPALKEMSSKYPDWLSEHRSTLSSQQLESYSRQLELMNRICYEFEQETTTDSDFIKTKRFETIVKLMQEMQELGQPPQDIVGEMAPGLSFDQQGLPNMEGLTGCSIM